MPAAIRTDHLAKSYGSGVAVHDLSLTVRPGTVFGLIGPNGAGKTTTLRMLLDIVRPTSGSAQVLGADPRVGGPALRRRIGYVPGELRLDGRLTGRQLLAFWTAVSGPVRPGRVDELVQRLEVDLDRKVGKLSKGNKQKLGLVQAFLHDPELLVLDEPTSGLDPLVQREFLSLVRQARADGRTVLLSSHVLSEIQQAADDVAVLAAGRVVAQGDVASLREGAVRRVQVLLVGAEADTVRTAVQQVAAVSRVDVATAGADVRLHATVEGEIDPLIKFLAGFRVADLTVEEPDLEESVLRLYSGSAS